MSQILVQQKMTLMFQFNNILVYRTDVSGKERAAETVWSRTFTVH